MPSWRKDNRGTRFCRGCLLRSAVWTLVGFSAQALCAFLLPAGLASAQVPQQKTSAIKPASPRANELTLAGLRPGRDNLPRATQLNKQFGAGKAQPGNQTVWLDPCRDLSLTIDGSEEKRIEVIRVGGYSGSTADCFVTQPSPWKTGHNLRVGDPSAKVVQLYGEPDSRSPSTRGGQPLELMYYAFDWAGPDVPQVMEVLCARGKDGQPGRVVEITLAAPSL